MPLVQDPSQKHTELFSIYQNNTWTIRCLVNETTNPPTQRIKLKIVYHITSNLEVDFVKFLGLLREHELYKKEDAIEVQSYYSFNNRWPNDDHEVGLG